MVDCVFDPRLKVRFYRLFDTRVAQFTFLPHPKPLTTSLELMGAPDLLEDWRKERGVKGGKAAPETRAA